MNITLEQLRARLVVTEESIMQQHRISVELLAKLEDALSTLQDIGDFAHDRSTGPVVEDDLWEIRRMAYEAL